MTLMKSIIITSLVLLVSFFSYGQVRDTTLVISKEKVIVDYDSSLNEAELREYFDDIRKNYIKASTKASNDVKSLIPQIPISADGCGNGGFENTDPYAGWTGLGLKHQNQSLPIENGLITNTGIMPFTSLNNPGGNGKYIQFQTTGTDPNLAGATPSTTLQKVVSGNQSIRLGNNDDGKASEGIAKRFIVTPANAKYYFQYAVVMDKSHSFPDGSPNGSEVFFIAEALDASGNTVDKIVDIGNPSNPFISAVTSSWATNGGTDNMYYRNWRCAYLDLSSLIGQEVTVFFINSDCSAGAHQGYTYLDAVCESCVNVNEGDINIDLEDDSCMDFPQTIEGSFVLPASGNAINETITLEIYQNNVLVNTLTSPTISGGNYSFSLSPSDFPNQDDGQCYDLVSILSFQIPDMTGTLQTVTQYSSEPTNGVQDGETPGLDNDVCFCEDDEPCCDIDDFDATIQENNGSFDVMINGGSVPLQEVEISMVDYHIEYAERDCQPDDLGVFGTLTTSNTTLGDLVLNPGDNGTSSLTWLLGNPSVINSSVNLDILNPEVLNLDCCDVEFYFCLKVKVKNVNCDDCETIICYSSDPQTEPDPCDIDIDPFDPDEKFCPGETVMINWSGSTPSGQVNVSLYDNTNNSVYSVLATGVTNTGSYSYTLPTTLPCEPPRYWSIIVEDAEDKECRDSTDRFLVECCDQQTECDCGEWKEGGVSIKANPKQIHDEDTKNVNNQTNFEQRVDCGDKIKLKASLNYTFTVPDYICNPEDCETDYKWEIIGKNGVVLSGTGQSFSYTFYQVGSYRIVFTPLCGGKECKPCIIGVEIGKVVSSDTVKPSKN